MPREEVGGRGVAADLHCTELIELPAVQIGGSASSSAIGIIVDNSVNSPDETDMDTHIPMHTRAF